MIQRIRDFWASRRIEKAFGAYIDPRRVEQMFAERKTPEFGGREVELTAIFANLENYLGIAEQVPLAQLPELMTAYFSVCTEALDAERATLDKFVGDAVVAMCGAPVPVADHALRACVAALRIQGGIAKLREKLAADGAGRWPELARQLRVCIGLHSGFVTVGNFGPPGRVSYTMMGDNVNLAARLEQSAKGWGARIVCTQDTKAAAEQHGAGRVIFRPLGAVVVMGRTQRVELHEPIALHENATTELRECLSIFNRGFACFRAKDWAGAAIQFETSARLEQEQPGVTPGATQNPSLVFLRMAQENRATPPDSLSVV